MRIRLFWGLWGKGVVWFVVFAFGVMGSRISIAQEQTPEVKQKRKVKEVFPDWLRDCGLRKGDVNAFVSHRVSKRAKKRSKAATIQVNYGSGFTAEAQDAFQRAVDIWELYIESDVTIRIDASFEDLDPGVLGAAGPVQIYAVDSDGDGELDRWYGDALIDAITGSNQNTGSNDIIARFNKDRDDWHFGEGDAPAGTIDFTTIVLHEIGHGLNYLGQTNVQASGEGEYGMFDFDNDGSGDGVPGIYTLFLAKKESDGSLTSLTNESVYPNPSQKLGDALTGDQIVYNGNESKTAASASSGPVPPKLYAPDSYQSGSSISHLDEVTYPFEGTNALMTPQIASAETNRQPGPIVCGQMADMGWPLGDECIKYFEPISDVQIVENGETDPGSVTLTWTEDTSATIQEYKIEQKYFDESFDVVKEGVSRPPVTLSSVGLGQYTYRVRWVNNDGTESASIQERSTTVSFESVTPEISKDENGRGTLDLTWTVPPGTVDGPRSFTYYAERARGRDTTFERLETLSQSSSSQRSKSSQQYTGTVDQQPPGRYKYRIAAVDGEGNTVTSASNVVEVSLDGATFIAGPFPNPVQDRARVELTARDQQTVSVGIYNAIGEEVYFEQREIQERRPTRFNFDTARWGSGLYLLRVTGSTFTRTQKFVVVQ